MAFHIKISIENRISMCPSAVLAAENKYGRRRYNGLFFSIAFNSNAIEALVDSLSPPPPFTSTWFRR